MYTKHLKAVNSGVIQAEYFATGLKRENCYGVTINEFYSEGRGNFNPPIPRGYGIEMNITNGIIINGGWVEGGLSFVELASCTV